jgi:hypothetical protein
MKRSSETSGDPKGLSAILAKADDFRRASSHLFIRKNGLDVTNIVSFRHALNLV